MADPNQPSSSSSDSRAGTEGKRTIEEEVEYLNLVSDTFGSRNDSRYHGFLRVMEYYKKGEIDTPRLISWVKLMFEGHHELLTGFNILLPRGYSIDSVVPENDPHKKEDAAKAFPPVIDLVNKIKARTQDGNEYRSFLNVILKFREDRDVNVFKELPIIFKDYPDLLAEFYFLFPNAREVPEKCTEGRETGQKSLV